MKSKPPPKPSQAPGAQAPPPAEAAAEADFRQPRPLLGPSLWVAGASLWAYVVMGELVVEARFPETLAVAVVFGAYAVAWLRSVRGAGSVALAFAPGIAGPLLCGALVLLTMMLAGSSRRSDVETVTVGLWLIGAATYFVGRRVTALPRPEPSRLRRGGTIAVWLVSGLTTALALVAALERV